MRQTTRHLLELHRRSAPMTDRALEAARHARQRLADDRRRRATGLLMTAAVALLAHAALVFPVFAAWLTTEPEDRVRPDVRVVQLGGSAWEQNRTLRDREMETAERERPQPPPVPPAEPDPEEVDIPGQVVKIAPPRDQTRPQQADYVAEYDSSTDRETSARVTARVAKNVTRQAQVGVDAPKKQAQDSQEVASESRTASLPGGPEGDGRAAEGDEGDDKDKDKGGAPSLAFEVPGQQKQNGLDLERKQGGDFLNRDALRQIDSPYRRFRLSMGRTNGDQEQRDHGLQGERTGQGKRGGAGAEGRPSLAQLTPSYRDLQRVTGAPANDWLPNVESDAETSLNAWRWKHSTFFNRITDGIRRTWAGPELLQKNDPSGEVFGTQELLTILAVTIDQQGNVVELAVKEPSGADFLDDEALRTFRETGPFTNPPVALFKGEDRFTFTFGFNVSYRKTEFDLNWRPY